MGKKSRKKKKKRRKTDTEQDYEVIEQTVGSGAVIYDYRELCEHPLSVRVGNHRIVLVGWYDFSISEHLKKVSTLDFFIGLDKSWNIMLKPDYSRYPERMHEYLEWYDKEGEWMHNLIVLPIDDWDINEVLVKITIDILMKGKKLGFGCQGAHGRTGWLAARLIQHFERCSGDEAVDRIRKRFCKKCVESKAQLDDLGCVEAESGKKADPEKKWWFPSRKD